MDNVSHNFGKTVPHATTKSQSLLMTKIKHVVHNVRIPTFLHLYCQKYGHFINLNYNNPLTIFHSPQTHIKHRSIRQVFMFRPQYKWGEYLCRCNCGRTVLRQEKGVQTDRQTDGQTDGRTDR
jgi:hypothetical protein